VEVIVLADISNVDLLSRLMDVAALRHGVLAHNIANVNTPGFKKSEVEFEQEFQQALDRGGRGAARVQPVISESIAPALRNDGNNVDIDKELGSLGKNAMLFRTYSTLLSRHLSLMESAVTGKT